MRQGADTFITETDLGANYNQLLPSGDPLFSSVTLVSPFGGGSIRLVGTDSADVQLDIDTNGSSKALNLGGSFTVSGSAIILTAPGTTNVTLPTTGTLAAIAGDQNLSITNTVPTLTLNDSTASAKDVRIRVDGGFLFITESGGTDGDGLTFNLTTNQLGIGTAAPAAGMETKKSDAGNVVQMRCWNTEPSNGASHSRITALTSGGGDPSIYCGVVGQSYDWTVGVDVTAAGIFFISHSTAVGTSPAMSFDLSMNATLYQNLTLTDAKNIILGGTTGNKIGTSATAQKLGLFNAAAIVQPTASGQAALAAQGQQTLIDSSAGTAGTTLAAIVGAVYTTDVATLRNWCASLAAQLALVKTDIANLRTLADAKRTAMVNLGSMKGS